MGKNSAIEWTKHTWNPWVGCFKVSQGCKNCYMYREQNQYGNDPKEIRRTKDPTFYAPKRWNEKDPGLVFTCSWSDWFLPEADPQWREDAWDVIRQTPNNTYQILTKRPELIPEMLPDDWEDGWPNVWLGTSVENQEMADKRIPILLEIPAVVRWLSCEPLLGPIDLWKFGGEEGFQTLYDYRGTYPMYQAMGWPDKPLVRRPGIDWVIVGGESGLAAHARPMHPMWAEDLLHQCLQADVPFFFKQWGQWYPDEKGGWPFHEDGHFLKKGYQASENSYADFAQGIARMNPAGRKKVPPVLLDHEWKQMPKPIGVTSESE